MNDRTSENERWKDPDAWSCLDDNQREIIHDWYVKICKDEKQENEEKKKRSRIAANTISIPLSVWYAVSKQSVDEGIVRFIINFALAFVFFIFLSTLSYIIIDIDRYKKVSKSEVIFRWIVYGIVSLAILIRIY